MDYKRQQYSGSGTLHAWPAWVLCISGNCAVLVLLILRITFAICSKIVGRIGEQNGSLYFVFFFVYRVLVAYALVKILRMRREAYNL